MELMETIANQKSDDEEVVVNLITGEDDFKSDQQTDFLEKVQMACTSLGIRFSWRIDKTGTLHARHIITDHGWKISLDRGMDIFQQYEMNDAFAVNTNQHP